MKPDIPCKSCVLYGDGCGYVPADGSGANGVLVVAEAAGENETKDGLPLIGKAGHFLWSALNRAGVEREGFKVHNVLSCRPPNNLLAKASYEQEVIEHCSPLLDHTINEMKEQCKRIGKTFVIVTLGRIAFKRVMGFTDKHPVMSEDYLNYPFWNERYSCWCLAADHPSYLMRGNNHLIPVLTFAFKRALEIAENGLTLDTPQYLLDPEPATFDRWVQDYLRVLDHDPLNTYLSYDIETPFKQGKDEEEVAKEDNDDYTILRCSFSYRENEAVSVPWSAQWLPMIEELFAGDGIKLGWNNSTYDTVRVKAQMPINGSELDGMLAWHVLNSSLRKGLGYVTPFYAQNTSLWKHLSDSQPAFYNCLSRTQSVVLANGKRRLISDIVENKEKVSLLGMDEEGRPIPVKVIDWHKSENTDNWLLISAGGQRERINCTGDHKVWTRYKHFNLGGWKRADSLQVGESILMPRVGSESFIHGKILGDGSLSGSGRSLSFSQVNKAWALRGAAHLGVKHLGQDTNHWSKNIQWRTTATIGVQWKKLFTKKKRKIFVPPPDPAALAVWYCDDGCLADKRAPNFAMPGNWGKAVDWFQKQFGFENVNHWKHKNAIYVALRGKAVDWFYSSIAIYVPPEMYYKMPNKYKDCYNGWLEKPVFQWQEIQSITTPKAPSPRYCVSVDHPTQRFFTPGGLVHNCKDADMALRNFLGIKKNLIDNGQWATFDRHVIQVDRVFKYMGDIGVARDGVMRLEAEKRVSGLLNEVEGGIQAAVPEEARQLKIYKKIPKQLDGLVQVDRVVAVKRCSICHLQNPKKVHFKAVSAKKLKLGLDNVCEDAEVVVKEEIVKLWAKPLEFKLSKLQLMKYQLVVGHTAIINRKENKVTFDKSAIERLRKRYPGDELYSKILEYRGLEKLLSVYIGETQADGRVRGGMQVGRDNRIHTLFTHNPSTLRSASQNPNLQNCPRPKGKDDLATIIRNLIYAEPGKILTARDYSGIEAVLVGYFAAAPRYIRLAKMDVHSYYTAWALHELDGRVSAADLPDATWPDEKLIPHLAGIKKEFKKERNELYKHLVHGANFMQSPKGAQEKIFAETNIEYPIKTVARVMNIYFELFPEIRKWHSALMLQADKDGYLRNPFNYIHRFSHVFDWKKENGKWVKEPGADANRVIAFLPQSTAAGIIKEAMLRLFYQRFNEAGQYLRLLIHDELFSEVPEELVDMVDAVMKEEMEKAIPELRLPASYGMGSCLSIMTEAKRGMRWGQMS